MRQFFFNTNGEMLILANNDINARFQCILHPGAKKSFFCNELNENGEQKEIIAETSLWKNLLKVSVKNINRMG